MQKVQLTKIPLHCLQNHHFVNMVAEKDLQLHRECCKSAHAVYLDIKTKRKAQLLKIDFTGLWVYNCRLAKRERKKSFTKIKVVFTRRVPEKKEKNCSPF